MNGPDYSQLLLQLVKAVQENAAKDWVYYVSAVVTAASAVLVAWSVFLTRRMQQAAEIQANASTATMREAQLQREQSERQLKEMQEQARFSQMPVIILDHGDQMSTTIANIGAGPAFTIRVIVESTAVSLKEPLEIGVLTPGGNGKLDLSVLVEHPKDEFLTVPLTRLRQRLAGDIPVELVITYSDLAGREYSTRIRVVGDKNSTLRFLSHSLIAGTQPF
ncbi:MAG TPA: hypothetical protein VGK29_22760 [Paludibaculum sp.]|jgi:hypothetical protein